MRIIINIDGIRENGKRLRIRTRYNRTNRDGKLHLQVQNAMVDFYADVVHSCREGCDPTITDFVDEGEKE